MKKLFSVVLCLAMLLSLCACTSPDNGVEGQNACEMEPDVSDELQETPDDVMQIALSGEKDAITGTWPEMQTADFWINLDENAQQLRMTAEECEEYRTSVQKTGGTGVTDLSRYGAELTLVQLMSAMPRGTQPEGNYYIGNQLMKDEEREAIRLNSNMAGLEAHAPEYGFVLRSSQMRGFPTDTPFYSSPGDIEFDQNAETRVKCWEPFVLLHTSADGLWYLVRTEDYTAWLWAEDAALCSREEWDALRQRLSENFVQVTGAHFTLPRSAEAPEEQPLTLEMGTKLPLEETSALVDNASTENCWSVLLPKADENGQLVTVQARIPKGDDLHEGYLPYTGETLLRQAFRLLGQRYGWGGMYESWDCSSFCQDVYSTMGVKLPRNSGDQSKAPGRVDVSSLSEEEKIAQLQQLAPGTLVTMSGHQTMYIGTFDGEPYLMHATYALYDTVGRKCVENAVMVSSALAFRSNGKSLLECSHTFVLPEKNSEKTA